MSRWKILSTKQLDASVTDFLQQHNIDVIEKNFIRINSAITDSDIENIQQSQGIPVVFTSANAVEAVKEYLQHSSMTVVCMAGKTKKTVEKNLLNATIMGTAESTRAIADKIIENGIEEVVFFCGNRRRDELPALLRKNKVLVNEIVVYKTEETPVAINGAYDAVLFFSPSAVSSFFSLNQLTQDAVCFSIGETTAEEIKKYTNSRIMVADSPAQDALAKKIAGYFRQMAPP